MASIEVKQYAMERGIKTALVRVGPNGGLEVLTMDGKLTVRRVPKTEERYMCDTHRNSRPYPLKRAVKTFRKFGRANGISKNAKKFLREASQ